MNNLVRRILGAFRFPIRVPASGSSEPTPNPFPAPYPYPQVWPTQSSEPIPARKEL